MSDMKADTRKKNKMSILVVYSTQWSDSVASGNTFSNLFGDWNEVKFLNLYLREEPPQNNICSHYYNITEKQIIKNILSPGKIGREFFREDLDRTEQEKKLVDNIYNEKKFLDFFRSDNMIVFRILRELLWKAGRWKNSRLDDFLTGNEVDIVFAPGASSVYLNSIINYCTMKTGAKLVLFFADDIYSHKSIRPLRYLYKAFIRKAISNTVENAAWLYGISPKLSDEYKACFGREVQPLYKGCDLERYAVKNSVSSPIKIVYAGNLFYNRWKTLSILADEIEKVNVNGIKITLEVYTGAEVTPELDKSLNREPTSKVMGPRPYAEIKEILAGADIVLHVESFDKEAIKTTRLSLSTKIIDCMQSGSCMMAIGPAGIASMEYLKEVDGAIAITDLAKIGDNCRAIVQNPAIITEKAAALRRYAQAHHNITAVREKLQKDFTVILANGQQI